MSHVTCPLSMTNDHLLQIRLYSLLSKIMALFFLEFSLFLHAIYIVYTVFNGKEGTLESLNMLQSDTMRSGP